MKLLNEKGNPGSVAAAVRQVDVGLHTPWQLLCNFGALLRTTVKGIAWKYTRVAIGRGPEIFWLHRYLAACWHECIVVKLVICKALDGRVLYGAGRTPLYCSLLQQRGYSERGCS